MNPELEVCVFCARSSQEIPLLLIRHQGETSWICPQHLPVLIHKPMQLVDKLPGVKNLVTPDDH